MAAQPAINTLPGKGGIAMARVKRADNSFDGERNAKQKQASQTPVRPIENRLSSADLPCLFSLNPDDIYGARVFAQHWWIRAPRIAQ